MQSTVKRALLSVYDKTGIVELGKGLAAFGVEIISTGGTLKLLTDNGVAARHISEVTGFPEILDGRVKTLHPMIYGGLLARRDDPNHIKQLEEHGIKAVDMVVANLYPFEEVIKQPGCELSTALENIDIGGPCMIRASAKNFMDVIILTDPSDYSSVLSSLTDNGDVLREKRLEFAVKAFKKTSGYDAVINRYLAQSLE